MDGGRGGMDQVARFLDAPSVQFQLVHAARGSGGGGCYGVDGGGHHVHTGPVVPPGMGEMGVRCGGWGNQHSRWGDWDVGTALT